MRSSSSERVIASVGSTVRTAEVARQIDDQPNRRTGSTRRSKLGRGSDRTLIDGFTVAQSRWRARSPGCQSPPGPGLGVAHAVVREHPLLLVRPRPLAPLPRCRPRGLSRPCCRSPRGAALAGERCRGKPLIAGDGRRMIGFATARSQSAPRSGRDLAIVQHQRPRAFRCNAMPSDPPAHDRLRGGRTRLRGRPGLEMSVTASADFGGRESRRRGRSRPGWAACGWLPASAPITGPREAAGLDHGALEIRIYN